MRIRLGHVVHGLDAFHVIVLMYAGHPADHRLLCRSDVVQQDLGFGTVLALLGGVGGRKTNPCVSQREFRIERHRFAPVTQRKIPAMVLIVDHAGFKVPRCGRR